MIKYLGSKRRLVPLLVDVVGALSRGGPVLDLFSGTSRVGHALKRAGHRVFANDHNTYAATLARCYVQADAERVLPDARRLIDELTRLPGRPGYFTHTFCERSRYVHPRNGERIDAIRDAIARKALEPELEAVLLTSLMEAADRVDSTVGVQMAYLKQWAPRALKDLELRVPDVLPRAFAGPGEAWQLDALEAAGRQEVDVAYLDPPYNQHKYVGNYHVWETLVRWDAPETYGVACKRVDVRARRSAFNARAQIAPALEAVLGALRTRTLVLSFSDEGFLDETTLQGLLGRHGHVTTVTRTQPRYVGARIGIHDPQGRRVGRVGATRNRERIFLVTPDPLAAATLEALDR